MYDRLPFQPEEDKLTIPNLDARIPPFRTDLPPSARRSAAPVAFLVLLFCVFGGAYWMTARKSTTSTRSNEPAPAAVTTVPPATLPASESEDLIRHLENAASNIAQATEELKRSQTWIERTLPSLDRNYLAVEKSRLQSASAASDAAHRYIEQAREEMEIAKNVLIERRK